MSTNNNTVAVHGNDGYIKVGTGSPIILISNVQGGSYTETVDLIAYSSMQDTEEFYASDRIRKGSGTIDVLWVGGDTTGQDAIEQAKRDGTPITIGIYVEGEASGDKIYEGAVLIESFSMTTAKDALVTGSYSFRGLLDTSTLA